MNLADYITVLRRRWWVPLLTAVIAAVAAYAFSKLQTPVYRSTAEYVVQGNQIDFGLSQAALLAMNTFRDLSLTTIQLEKISNQLSLDRSAAWLAEHVTIQARPENSKMVIQADYPEDPETARRLAQAVGDNMVAVVTANNARIDQGTGRIFVTLMQPATDPVLQRPQTRVNVLAGLVLGLILGLLLAFLLEALDNTLKTAGDVERFVGLTTLGVIPTSVAATRNKRGP